MYRSLLFFILTATFVSGLGCTAVQESSKGRKAAARIVREVPPVSPAEPLPWEIWQPFYDQTGARFSNTSLLLGDEYLRKGKRRSALEAYLTGYKAKLSDAEAEAATLRITSQYLALDESPRALATVSTYFKNRGLAESDVSTPFCLLLAYSYGRYGDIDQSLAWFSKAHRQAYQSELVGAQAAAGGLMLFLRTIPEASFESIALNWNSDPFVNEYIGRERMRRASPGYRFTSDLRMPFWQIPTEISTAPDGTSIGESGGRPPVIGVVLSLSDRFGSLGRDTKQGFDLAVEADTGLPKIRVEARDVGADTAAASAAVRELVATSNPSVVVGPLLTDVSVAAAETAQELRVPLLSFSKSEAFPIGGVVTRLGATTTSQVEALVTATFKDYGISRYAIVYPESANGNEVLQVFKKKLASVGLNPVLEAPYVVNDEASVLEAAQRLEGAGAQAVLIPDTIDASVKLLSNISNATRRRTRPLGIALWDNPSKVANSQALFESAIFVTPFFPQSTRPVVQQFNESYKGKYKVAPNFLAAQGFDAGTLVVAALHKAAREGSGFNDALASLPPYEGVTGFIETGRGGEIRRNFYVVEVTPNGFLEHFPGSSDKSGSNNGGTTTSEVIRTGPALLKEDERVDSGY